MAARYRRVVQIFAARLTPPPCWMPASLRAQATPLRKDIGPEIPFGVILAVVLLLRPPAAEQKMASNSTILGAAGEHYVMCQLLRRDLIAALAPTGVPNADIIVTDKIGDQLCAIQVKVRRDIGSDGGWHMKAKHEKIVSPNMFYSFVDFGTSLSDQPKCWVVPSKVVAYVVKTSHSNWLASPGKKGQQHKDSVMRRLLPSYERHGMGPKYGKGWLDGYFEKWETIATFAR